MLNFTTTNIVNDPTRVSVKKGLLKSDGSRGVKFVVKHAVELFVDDEHCPKLLKKTDYADAKLAQAKVSLADLVEGDIYRIALYIRIQNNNSSSYANDWTFKGKPLYIEFVASEEMTAPELVKLVRKYQLVEYGKNLVKVEAEDDTTLIITATDQWQKFMDQDYNDGVSLQHLVPVQVSGDIVRDEWELKKDAVELVERGVEAFGDFAHLVKDFRLPTGANLRWQGIAQGDVYGGEPNDDLPSPTGKYTQYTIQYDAERGIQMQTALGGLGTSRTIHVFYVESAAVEAFDSALEAAGIAVKNTYTEANRVNLATDGYTDTEETVAPDAVEATTEDTAVIFQGEKA